MSSKFEIQLFTTENQEEVLPIKMSVSAAEVTPPNKSVFIGSLMFVIVGLVVFISVIYYYEKIERKLSEIYDKLAARQKKQKKYDVGGDAAVVV